MGVIAGFADARETWFWTIADAVVAALLFLNLLLIVAVHGRRLRQAARTRRQKRVRTLVEDVLAELDPRTSTRDRDWLRRQIRGFNELERPIAAVMLIERVQPVSEEERQHVLGVLREVGAIELLVRSTRRWMPWRRALAVRTLGWVAAEECVPVVIERVSDRNRYVREASVRALGRIGDTRALPIVGQLFRAPGVVGAGVAYDALVAFGESAEPIFAGALRSQLESVRVAACFGVAAVSEPGVARPQLVPLLSDSAAPVRAAAAEALGQIGGGSLPEALARATRDEFAAVRSAATQALGAYDDPRGVELASNALLDPDRDTAVRAGETLVRLSRAAAARAAAAEALARAATAWPVERAVILDALGAV